MERFVGQVAVVTGSSSGIGEAISKRLMSKGLIVVGLARRIAKLQKLAEDFASDPKTYIGRFHPRQCDVSNPKEIKDAFQWISGEIGPVSILINNAGILPKANLFDLDEGKYNQCFDTNVKGLIMCTKEAAKFMMDNKSGGHIVNINSIVGHKVLNLEKNEHLLYTASKYAVTALSEGLRYEVIRKNSNIKVTNLSPGVVVTEMVTDYVPIWGQEPDKILRPEDIADACIAVLNTPPHVLISEITVQPIHPAFS